MCFDRQNKHDLENQHFTWKKVNIAERLFFINLVYNNIYVFKNNKAS